MSTFRFLGMLDFNQKSDVKNLKMAAQRLEAFTKAATTMLLGEDSAALKEGRTFGVQVAVFLNPMKVNL